MRRDLNKPTVPIGVNIPVSDFEALAHLLPFGARSWIIERGITSFCAVMESSPRLQRWASTQTKKMLFEDDRPGPTREMNAKLPTDLYIRFSKVHAEHGGMTWFIRRYIKFLVESLRGGLTLEEQIEAVVSRAMTPEAGDKWLGGAPEIEPEAVEIVHQGPDE